MVNKIKTPEKKKETKKATLLKSDLSDNVHLEREDGKYYVIFNVHGSKPFFIEFALLDSLVTNYREIIRAQGGLKNGQQK